MRYLWWLVRCQPWRVLRGSLIGTAWMIGLSVRPYLIARAVDDGLRARDTQALALWVAAIVVAGVALSYLGIMRHRTMTFLREDAKARSAEVLLRHLSRIGAVLPRRVGAGEVSTIGGSDIDWTAQVLTLTGPGVGAVIAYGVIAVVLWSISPMLALCVLVGVPVVGLIVGPLLRRLEQVESVYRRQQGALTARSGDIVAGLRVLAGVGGRDLFARRYAARSQELRAEGYRVGAVNSWIDAATVAIPGLFLAAVVWLTARMAVTGDVTIGELVAVYGYVATLIVPVWFLLEGSYQLIRGRVAARRITDLLNVTPDDVGGPGRRWPGAVPETRRPDDPAGPEDPADLHDPVTGLTVRAGQLTAVAADDPAAAVALADRLGRYVASDVTWGGVPLREVALDEVRARILVADHDSYLFAGTLRDILRAGADGDDQRIGAALRTASAQDVVDALPAGLDTPIDARARTLSGGQRQRLRLARALSSEPEVLILVDPTSAVDAHTEARIAERLRAARAGRTTVVIATSPLLLGRADVVALLSAGRITATGSHADLLDDDPAYRHLVARGSEEAYR
ncbi:ABC transporter ATP-binding protein/permease [Micromonospora sp. NBC_00362]|uniref:ABC transporter ATP-binding protein n=1 Tax=unclassified Micromonospora TaxID=2617518 RepID=UPI00224EFD9F|nr:ABC transporter ATP-binding protein [Micromonospora sp. NBC_00362]MCX5121650.1 ABC transporter ATP-binding protein/permease [Micromonospora sp. NBC_00362]WTI11427.1 ABC transporter ATP-binding protein/permease [Micromonospora sp. NBC_00821]